jgi:hypothetical protein
MSTESISWKGLPGDTASRGWFILRLRIQREKQLKKWNRAWKLRQIREVNPNLEDLYETLIDPRAKPEDDGKLAARDDKARSSA